jgi:Na+/H+-dicarboxylate symporter
MTATTYRHTRIVLAIAACAGAALASASADASMFVGETLDKVADALAWVVLIIVPVVGIAVFWLVHILPEKIAEQKRHPQAKAIQVLCLLSLVFGGLLWPLAWLWAYTKPALYKLAYGTDVAEIAHGEDGGEAASAPPVPAPDEIATLRERLAALETQVSREARG